MRLVTLNVLHGGLALRGDGQRLEERLALAVEALRALDADVIGLQEASAGRRRGDVAARLAAALGVHHVRAAAGFRWGGAIVSWAVGFTEGPAILSRFPIVRHEAIPLRDCGSAYGRVLLCAELQTPWGPLEACSTHTDGSACQLRSLASLLRHRRGDAPRVLFGDLNSTPGASGVRHLVAQGLVDTFHAANPHADGFTVWQPVRHDRASASRRVDYVLVAPGRDPVRVRASRVVVDRPHRASDGGPLWPSDHYGVLSEVEVFQPARREP